MHTAEVSTKNVALGLLGSDLGASWECRLDGESLDAGEAAGRLRALPPGRSALLSLTREGSVFELRVTGEPTTLSSASRREWRVGSRWR